MKFLWLFTKKEVPGGLYIVIRTGRDKESRRRSVGKISEIKPKDIIAWQNEMLNSRDKRREAYSPVYLKTLHNQLSASFQQRNLNLYVFSAHLHMDEAAPHIHIDFVSLVTGSTRGLDTRVSLKKALDAQDFHGGTRGATEWNQWVQSEKEQLAQVMEHYGFEWEQLGTHEQHLSVIEYKKQERSNELAAVEEKLSEKTEEFNTMAKRVNSLDVGGQAYEDMEQKLAHDPEFQLTDPQALMTAKA